MPGEKIRIRLKSFDHNILDKSASDIVRTVTKLQATQDFIADKIFNNLIPEDLYLLIVFRPFLHYARRTQFPSPVNKIHF